MIDSPSRARQRAIQARCVHPTGVFVEFPPDEIEQSIGARFEQQARRHPDRVAVKTPGRQLTYAELDRAANRLANALLARCPGSQAPVALLLPKGVDLVLAVLGVLKAGHVCMPLDPVTPAARLAAILDEAAAGLVITAADQRPPAGTFGGRPVLEVGSDGGAGSADHPAVTVSPDALAYIFFTSGSTGTPKGIAETHRNLLHHVMSETNALHICPEDRLTFLASTGRDVLRALSNGAALYPVDLPQDGLDAVATWLAAERVTMTTMVVSAFRHLAGALTGRQRLPDLRVIKLIGESVTRRDVELYRERFSDHCVLVNSYGPNEAGHLSHFFVDKETPLASAVVPIGYTVEGKEVLVVADDGRELGADEAGEIVARSRYLSPGYWRRPDLTRAAFSPASPGDAERLYRTGDLGTRAADGCLTHLGRKDLQVKILGFRVEVMEVEQALSSVDGVAEAVVVAREDVPGHQRLVAYVVPARRPAPTTSELRRSLVTVLPDYMVPSAFVWMDALPLVGIGKVDRRALPAPGRDRPTLASPYVAPRTSVEAAVSRLWADTLDLERVGVDDPFLDLGGDSLLAMRIVSRLCETFGIDAPPQAFLDARTVAEMAVVVVERQARGVPPAELARMLARLEGLPER